MQFLALESIQSSKMRIPYLSSLCFMGRHAWSSDCQIWLTRFNCIVGGIWCGATCNDGDLFLGSLNNFKKCLCSQVYNSIGDINDILLALSPLLYINCTMYIYPLFSLAHIASNPCAENRIYTRHLGGLDSSVIRKHISELPAKNSTAAISQAI